MRNSVRNKLSQKGPRKDTKSVMEVCAMPPEERARQIAAASEVVPIILGRLHG